MQQCKEPHDLLFAVDGTGSEDWRPAPYGDSHVYAFHRKFKARHKRFKDGPGTFGTNVDNIIDHGMRWIKDHVKMLKSSGATEFSPTVAACAADVRPKYDAEIVLVGHSRGATIVGDMAPKIRKELGIGVLFVGLFDAVDRSWNSEGGKMENVELTAHTLRNPTMPSERGPSRPSFGNSYTSSMSIYRYKHFNTSHGGVGGSPVTEYAKVAVTGDRSCAGASKSEILTIELAKKAAQGDASAARILQAQEAMYSPGSSPSSSLPLSRTVSAQQIDLYAAEARHFEEQKKRIQAYAQRCESESARAYQWMLSQAASINLPVN
jgi:hypothetical protein